MKRPLRPLALVVLSLAATPALAQYSTPMRDVENPDRFPYSERALNIDIPVNFVNGIGSFPTPAGKRYVVEYVTVDCNTSSAADTFPRVLLSLTKLTSPSSANFFNLPAVQMQRQGATFGGGIQWVGTAMLRAYSDAGLLGGSGISINIQHSDFTAEVTCNAHVFGHTFAL